MRVWCQAISGKAQLIWVQLLPYLLGSPGEYNCSVFSTHWVPIYLGLIQKFTHSWIILKRNLRNQMQVFLSDWPDMQDMFLWLPRIPSPADFYCNDPSFHLLWLFASTSSREHLGKSRACGWTSSRQNAVLMWEISHKGPEQSHLH